MSATSGDCANPNEPRAGLRVGILCAGWKPDLGGVESHTADLAAALIARGHEVMALCLDTRGADGWGELGVFDHADSDADGVRLRRIAYAYGDHRRLFDLLSHPQLDQCLRDWLVAMRPDVVHVHHLTGFGAGALAVLDAFGVPTVMTLHDYWMLDPRGQLYASDGRHLERAEPERLLTELLETWPQLLPSGGAPATGVPGSEYAGDLELLRAYRTFALEMLELPEVLVCPSRAAAIVFESAGVPSERIVAVENGVNCAGLRDGLESELRGVGESERPLTFGVLGTALPSKGQLEFAEAFLAARLDEILPGGARLEIHGACPSYHGDDSYIERMSEVAKRNTSVRLMGTFRHAELPRVLARLDCVVAPSRWEEVFGLTVREARAAGLPVLVSDAGALPDVTDGGRAGAVVPRYDAEAWIAALRAFARDPGQRERWSAHPYAPRDTGAMAVEIEGLYLDAIERRTGRRPRLALREAELAAVRAEQRPLARLRRSFRRLRGSFGRPFRSFGRPLLSLGRRGRRVPKHAAD